MLIGCVFDVLKTRKVIAHCDSHNTASEKVMKKSVMIPKDSTGRRFYSKTEVISGKYLYEIENFKRN